MPFLLRLRATMKKQEPDVKKEKTPPNRTSKEAEAYVQLEDDLLAAWDTASSAGLPEADIELAFEDVLFHQIHGWDCEQEDDGAEAKIHLLLKPTPEQPDN